jgi:hypothetical protein
VKADSQTCSLIVASSSPRFRGAMVNLTADEPVADGTDTVISWDATEFDTVGLWDSGNPASLTVPNG